MLTIVAVGLVIIGLVYGRSGSKPAPNVPSPGPTTTAAGSSSPSAASSPTLDQQKEQVRQAFFAYEDAYALAGKTLDPAPLSGVAAGTILQYSQAAVEHARSMNQPVLVRADHNITSIVVAQGLGGPGLGAQVDDSYVDHTVRLDPATMKPIEPDPNHPGKQSITFQEVSPGLWKAVFASGIN